MTNGFTDLARHNAWATARLLAFCQGLDEASLKATAPGTYGTIIETLRHIIDAEGSYCWRLTGAWPSHPWRGDGADQGVGLTVLAERATILASTLETFLEKEWDSERLGEARGDGGAVFAAPAGVFLTQLFHHANEHRAHIRTILGSLGIDPPSLSAWEYSFATGRSTVKQTLAASR